MERFPKNRDIQYLGAHFTMNATNGGSNGAVAARLRWAGAILVLAASAKRFQGDMDLQDWTTGALASCTSGGLEIAAAASVVDNDGDVIAVAALRSFLGSVGVAINACSLLRAVCIGWHSSRRVQPLADGAVAAAAGVFRLALSASKKADAHWDRALKDSAGVLANLTAAFPPCNAEAVEAGVVAVVAEALQSCSGDGELVTFLADFINNVANSCPSAVLDGAVTALEAAERVHGRDGGKPAETLRKALDSARRHGARKGKSAQQAASSQQQQPVVEPPGGAPCAQCGAHSGADGAPLKACSRCRQVRYCSKECQQAAWKGGHKQSCKQQQLQ